MLLLPFALEYQQIDLVLLFRVIPADLKAVQLLLQNYFLQLKLSLIETKTKYKYVMLKIFILVNSVAAGKGSSIKSTVANLFAILSPRSWIFGISSSTQD